VLAHECGHGGFSAYEWINDLVGFVLHTALYVPYFSWKFSHAKHHHYTNHMVRRKGMGGINILPSIPHTSHLFFSLFSFQALDEPFVPSVLSPEERVGVERGEINYPNYPPWHAAYTRWLHPFVMLILGWPLYLVCTHLSICLTPLWSQK